MTDYLDVPGGRLAYDDIGEGALIVAIPGMGDLRSSYRFLAPLLATAGYRVISVDVRGHGETSALWDDYSVGAIAGDVIRLIDALDSGPAHVIGNSMAAGAAVIAAARSPQAIRSLTLIAPFVRDIMPPWVTAAIFGPLLGGPWRAALWRAYFKRAFPTHVPADYDAEAARRDASLAEAGRFAAFRRMALASKAESEASVAGVRAPALVLMGSRDIDFSKPQEEATFVAELLGGRATMIDGAGHYPQAEFPDEVAAQIVPFLQSVDVRSKAVCFAP